MPLELPYAESFSRFLSQKTKAPFHIDTCPQDGGTSYMIRILLNGTSHTLGTYYVGDHWVNQEDFTREYVGRIPNDDSTLPPLDAESSIVHLHYAKRVERQHDSGPYERLDDFLEIPFP